MLGALALKRSTASLQAAAPHLPARLAIQTVAAGALQVVPAAPQAIEGDAIGGRVDGG
jgi:hypothetical protein